ncbi:MAG: HAMP domain-containing protein, partial [Deltaproteobacteria bacterium]
MNPLRSVGGRLSIGLAVVVALALALVDLIVVPSLERNLIHAKIGELRAAAPGIRTQIVSVFTALDADTMLHVGDSIGLISDLGQDPIVLQAARTLGPASGTVQREDQQFAEAALPMEGGTYVVLLSAPLRDSLASVHLVRRRLFIAGIIALAASLVVGYAAASMFARRLRRLERAAERIADGDFGEPVSDSGRDEVGELARAFERMRQRLAGLERARREFIANASHELRTPLFSLGGFLEL